MKIDFLEITQTELDDAFKRYEEQQTYLGKQYIQEFEASKKRGVVLLNASLTEFFIGLIIK